MPIFATPALTAPWIRVSEAPRVTPDDVAWFWGQVWQAAALQAEEDNYRTLADWLRSWEDGGAG
jgi:hypothetical protein